MQDLENEGYEFEAAEASFDMLVKKVAGLYRAMVRAAGLSGQHRSRRGRPAGHRSDGQAPRRRASHAHGQRGRRPGECPGRGAAQGAAAGVSALAEMQLVDYKVRVVNARAETAARVRVVIESRDGDDVWGTVGVSENIIEASWLALVDASSTRYVRTDDRPR